MWSYKMLYSSSVLYKMILLMSAATTSARNIDKENTRVLRTEIEYVLDNFHRRLFNEAERLRQLEIGPDVDYFDGFHQHGYPTNEFVGRQQVDNERRHDDHRFKNQPSRNIQIEVGSYVGNFDESNNEKIIHDSGRNHERSGSYRENNEHNHNINEHPQNELFKNPVGRDNFKSDSKSSEGTDRTSSFDDPHCNTTNNKQAEVSNRTLEKQHTNIEKSSNNYSSTKLRTNKLPNSSLDRQYNDKDHTVWPSDTEYEKTTKAYENPIRKNSSESVKVDAATPKSGVKGSNVSEIDDLEDRIAFDAPCPNGKKRVNGTCVETH